MKRVFASMLFFMAALMPHVLGFLLSPDVGRSSSVGVEMRCLVATSSSAGDSSVSGISFQAGGDSFPP